MYLLAEMVVTVACSQAKAFDYAANLENFVQWFPGVVSITANDALPTATTGKKYTEAVSVPLRGMRRVTIQVTDAAPPNRVVTHGDMRPLLPRMEMDFVQTGRNVCEVHWRMMSRNENRFAACTVLPLAGWVMGRRAKIGLRNLKLQLENAHADVTVSSLQYRCRAPSQM
ncbi:SRPBCC family protein [Mycolicibacterium fortuitum]|uniref:SRPBCC family protein n=1 Tax=Mycolicibacterium fortuitum TaxID=1766 RepID=UPI0007E9A8C9|nr:SRPBCC family protein [Mycolicibacterium fortuitum]OBB32650.1 hypothetical protein A5763_11140 [Mycolicibacterium fortuitum]OBB43162.1 hypothetical protein A5754_13375 [Mycolicibacterium fortuitum]OBB64755.1 hypothetical protein A5755_21405 [Mycolicibacterium fortuitum]OBF82004.1 hypothetical protein A5751_15965 [Mycolicibacterium fortuitum]OBG09957.1 hypothetical protein A5768_15110 [Mycolicibacterium fortuitum]